MKDQGCHFENVPPLGSHSPCRVASPVASPAACPDACYTTEGPATCYTIDLLSRLEARYRADQTYYAAFIKELEVALDAGWERRTKYYWGCQAVPGSDFNSSKATVFSFARSITTSVPSLHQLQHQVAEARLRAKRAEVVYAELLNEQPPAAIKAAGATEAAAAVQAYQAKLEAIVKAKEKEYQEHPGLFLPECWATVVSKAKCQPLHSKWRR